MKHEINPGRRAALKSGGATAVLGLFVAAGLVRPGTAQAQSAWNQAAFAAKGLDNVVKSLGGASAAQTKEMSWGATPEIAENGAVVPVSVATTLTDVTSISFLVSENPVVLVASYKIPAGTLPNIANRIKMAKTSNVIVVVEAGGKLYSATKEVKVTVGGCGG